MSKPSVKFAKQSFDADQFFRVPITPAEAAKGAFHKTKEVHFQLKIRKDGLIRLNASWLQPISTRIHEDASLQLQSIAIMALKISGLSNAYHMALVKQSLIKYGAFTNVRVVVMLIQDVVEPEAVKGV